MLHSSLNLIRLSANNNTFIDVSVKLLSNIHFSLLETTDYRLCCVISPSVSCTAPKPWYKSCSNLLHNWAIKVAFILVSVLVILLNVLSLSFHIVIHGIKSNIYKLVTAIHSNNCICGLYLITIWTTEVLFEEKYALRHHIWNSSFFCFLSLACLIFFNLYDPILSYVMALSRLMVVVYPVKSIFQRKNFLLKSIIIYSSSVPFFISLGFTLHVSQLVRMLPFGLCLPYGDPAHTFTSIRVITCLVALNYTWVSIVVVGIYLILVKELKNTPKLNKLTNVNNIGFIVQLSILSTSCILCWLPQSLIFICTQFMPSYPITMILWTVVAVLPINSVTDASVFGAMALR